MSCSSVLVVGSRQPGLVYIQVVVVYGVHMCGALFNAAPPPLFFFVWPSFSLNEWLPFVNHQGPRH